MRIRRNHRWRLARVVALIVLALPASAGSQAASPPPAATRDTLPVVRKSGTAATLWSALVPGAGHLYAHDYRTGAVLLSAVALGIAIGAGGENAVTPPGMLLIGVPWWYGVLTAHRAVERYNRRIDAGKASTQAGEERRRDVQRDWW